MTALEPLGDRAFLARFADENAARLWASAVRSETRKWPGLSDVVLAYRSVAVFADPEQIELESLEKTLKQIDPSAPSVARTPLRIELPVLYDGPDLVEVASHLGLSRDEVIQIHSSPTYDVFAIGFTPGFPYAGYLPPALAGLPRRPVPRTQVAAGSVAIAGRQTGVYPRQSPGGWHLLGRTPLRIVDLETEHFPIEAGDRLRFVPIDVATFHSRQGQLLTRPTSFD